MAPKQSKNQIIVSEVDRIIGDARERFCADLDRLANQFGLDDSEVITLLQERQGTNYADDYATYVKGATES